MIAWRALEQIGSQRQGICRLQRTLGPGHSAWLESPPEAALAEELPAHLWLPAWGRRVGTTPAFLPTDFPLAHSSQGENDLEVTTRMFAAFDSDKLNNPLV